jgi:formylglycine-generating enzyme required for sulfatase activity
MARRKSQHQARDGQQWERMTEFFVSSVGRRYWAAEEFRAEQQICPTKKAKICARQNGPQAIASKLNQLSAGFSGKAECNSALRFVRACVRLFCPASTQRNRMKNKMQNPLTGLDGVWRAAWCAPALLAGIHQAAAQSAQFFRISGPAATTITACSPDGTLVWSNAQAGVNYTVRTVGTLPGGANWVDYALLFATNTVNTNLQLLVAFAPPSGMVWIPPGTWTFVMGSPASEADRNSDEVQHTVTLSHGFYMGKYAVRQGQYLVVAGNNPSYFQTEDYYENPISPDLNRPVEEVSWSDATNYCALLTQSDRAAGRIPSSWGYRLPTEAEWEYACRAGTTTAFDFGSAIHGGMANFYDYDEYDAAIGDIYVANPSVRWLARTTTVGSYAPNAFGLYDMHGNVWEWCQDWFGAYPAGSVTDPQGPVTGSNRVDRGGCWWDIGGDCRSAIRDFNLPADWIYTIGFRVVLAPGQP